MNRWRRSGCREDIQYREEGEGLTVAIARDAQSHSRKGRWLSWGHVVRKSTELPWTKSSAVPR